MRLTMRSSVVLPHPDDPTNTVVVCEGSTRLNSWTASVPSGNVLPMLRYSIMRSSICKVGNEVGGQQARNSLAASCACGNVKPDSFDDGFVTYDDLLDRRRPRNDRQTGRPPRVNAAHDVARR